MQQAKTLKTFSFTYGVLHTKHIRLDVEIPCWGLITWRKCKIPRRCCGAGVDVSESQNCLKSTNQRLALCLAHRICFGCFQGEDLKSSQFEIVEWKTCKSKMIFCNIRKHWEVAKRLRKKERRKDNLLKTKLVIILILNERLIYLD